MLHIKSALERIVSYSDTAVICLIAIGPLLLVPFADDSLRIVLWTLLIVGWSTVLCVRICTGLLLERAPVSGLRDVAILGAILVGLVVAITASYGSFRLAQYGGDAFDAGTALWAALMWVVIAVCASISVSQMRQRAVVALAVGCGVSICLYFVLPLLGLTVAASHAVVGQMHACEIVLAMLCFACACMRSYSIQVRMLWGVASLAICIFAWASITAGAQLGIDKSIEIRPSLVATLTVLSDIYAKAEIALYEGAGPFAFASAWDFARLYGINSSPVWNEAIEYGYGLIPTLGAWYGVWIILCGICAAAALGYLVVVASYARWGSQGAASSDVLPYRILAFVGVVLLFYTTPSIPLAISIAMLIGIWWGAEATQGAESVTLRSRIVWVSACVVLLVAGGVVMWAGIAYSVALTHYHLAYTELQAQEQDVASARKNLELSIEWVASKESLNGLVSVLEMQTVPLLEAEKSADTAAKLLALATSEVAAAQNLSRLDPRDFRAALRLGYAETVRALVSGEADFGAASAAYRRAANLAPEHPFVWYAWARSEVLMGRPAEARAHVGQALFLKSDFAEAQRLLVVLDSRMSTSTDATIVAGQSK